MTEPEDDDSNSEDDDSDDSSGSDNCGEDEEQAHKLAMEMMLSGVHPDTEID